MLRLKSRADIEGIRRSGVLVAHTIRALRGRVMPGVSTRDLDRFVHEFVVARGARPAQLGYMGFPASLCASVNNEVIHGIPGSRVLREGDIVDLDIVVEQNGYYADACLTLPVGKVSEARQRLLRVTRECLYLAVEQAVVGQRIRDIASAVYEHARKHGYDVVRQFCGHGVGFDIHEEPQVPNYPGRGSNPRLKPGMILAVEPMVNAGGWEVEVLEDGWTVVTADGADSAHFEHTVCVTEGSAEILTPWDDGAEAQRGSRSSA